MRQSSTPKSLDLYFTLGYVAGPADDLRRRRAAAAGDDRGVAGRRTAAAHGVLVAARVHDGFGQRRERRDRGHGLARRPGGGEPHGLRRAARGLPQRRRRLFPHCCARGEAGRARPPDLQHRLRRRLRLGDRSRATRRRGDRHAAPRIHPHRRTTFEISHPASSAPSTNRSPILPLSHLARCPSTPAGT